MDRVKCRLAHILKEANLRGVFHGGRNSRRFEIKQAHGFRKWFKTQAEQAMRPINVEILMGHSVGVSDSYYRPTEAQLLEDYLKAVPLLLVTGFRDVSRLEEKIKAEFESRIALLEAGMRDYLLRQGAGGS